MAEEETKPAHGDSSRIQVDVVRMFLSCGICGELLKDARSITECLHTFCRDCLLNHFEYELIDIEEADFLGGDEEDDMHKRKKVKGSSCACPVCGFDLGPDPWRTSVRSDKMLQNLATKLAPFLCSEDKDESKHEEVAEKTPDNQVDIDSKTEGNESLVNDEMKKDVDSNTVKKDIVVKLVSTLGTEDEHADFENLPELDLPHVKTSADVTIRQLRKFIASQVGLNQEESALVDISCLGESLGTEYNLEFIKRTRWHETDKALELNYRKKIKID